MSLASFIILFQLTHPGSSNIVRQVAQVSQLRFLGRGIGCHCLASQKDPRSVVGLVGAASRISPVRSNLHRIEKFSHQSVAAPTQGAIEMQVMFVCASNEFHMQGVPKLFRECNTRH